MPGQYSGHKQGTPDLSSRPNQNLSLHETSWRGGLLKFLLVGRSISNNPIKPQSQSPTHQLFHNSRSLFRIAQVAATRPITLAASSARRHIELIQQLDALWKHSRDRTDTKLQRLRHRTSDTRSSVCQHLFGSVEGSSNRVSVLRLLAISGFEWHL